MKALEVAQENFKGFERKDAQLNMELGHVKQKLRKTEAKIESDAGNMKVGNSNIWVYLDELHFYLAF